MTEYITKEQAMELACRACEYTCYGEWERCGVKEWADDIPSADVVPWEWLKRYSSGMFMNYASDWVDYAEKVYKEKMNEDGD